MIPNIFQRLSQRYLKTVFEVAHQCVDGSYLCKPRTHINWKAIGSDIRQAFDRAWDWVCEQDAAIWESIDAARDELFSAQLQASLRYGSPILEA